MKFGIALGALNPHFHLDATREAERLGFESVWLPEHLVFTRTMTRSPHPGQDVPPVPPSAPIFDAFAYLAHLAAHTERLRLGTHVFNIGLRHPFTTARGVQTVDLLSGGRFEFGIGASWLEQEWDAVLRVHLNGHYFPTRFAAEHWRAQAKDSGPVSARIIYTTSEAGLFGHIGQVNYAAAKAGITGMCFTVAQELDRVGVTVNVVSPRGRTPMTIGTFGEIGSAQDGFDSWDPANVAPMVVFLAREEAADISGQVFVVYGGTVSRHAPWQEMATIKVEHRWQPDELLAAVSQTLVPQHKAPHPEFPVEV